MMRSTETPTPDPTSDEEFVRSLPKLELHLHLEGAMPPDVLFTLRKKHQVNSVPDSLDRLRSWFEFRDFAHFIDVYRVAVTTLRDANDFDLLVSTVATALADQGVRYAEVMFTPALHLDRGVPAAQIFEGIERGRRTAEQHRGIQLRWIADVPGDIGPYGAERTLDAVLPAYRAGELAVVGFGLAGPEVERKPFARAFGRARDAGLHAVPHAGEVTDAESIWQALDALGAERIGHGISAVDDAELLDRLREQQVPLDVCPTSNLRTGVVAGYAEHPLLRLIAAGLAVSINSDDPAMFDTTLADEYLHCLRDIGLTREQLIECLRSAARSSFADDVVKEALLAEIGSIWTELDISNPQGVT